VLSELASYADVSSALAAERAITPVMPKLVVGDDERLVFLLPGDDGY
jgi:hypothetical protein